MIQYVGSFGKDLLHVERIWRPLNDTETNRVIDGSTLKSLKVSRLNGSTRSGSMLGDYLIIKQEVS